jgi:hypothetical protein
MIKQEVGPGGEEPHVGVPLFGRFKARSSALSKVLILMAAVTASGLRPGLWAQRLVDTLGRLGITTGWVFQDEKGGQRPLSHFADGFYRILFAVRDRRPELFEPNTDIFEDYAPARSGRRGGTSRATNVGVSASDIDWVNRWNTGGEEIVSGPMRVIYAERKHLLDTFLRFSKPL